MFQVKRVLIVATASLAAASLAACGGDDGGEEDAGATQSSTTAAPTTPTTLDTETEVEQAYLAFEDMLTRLREAPNPDDREIERRTTGQTRDALVSSLATIKSVGETVDFGDRQAVHVLGIDFVGASTAVVHSCAVEDLTVTNAAGAQRHELATYWTDYTMNRDGANWRVSYSEAIKKLDGEQPCEE